MTSPTIDPVALFADVWMTLYRIERNSIEEMDSYIQKEIAHVRIEKNHFGAASETLSFRPMLHIQKFTEWDY
ncbi:MAG: hypothetical protein KIT80_19660 [Chitinophagaceae bacterium]|nr:hypothetical protein [Chitinophagaceae bacterium]MCW5929146.1 hypothetical protein [Chitinophagaceae bacterium]